MLVNSVIKKQRCKIAIFRDVIVDVATLQSYGSVRMLWRLFKKNGAYIQLESLETFRMKTYAGTRKKFILEELPNSSETEDMRKIR